MGKVTEYKQVEEKEVQDYINQGWQPFGSPYQSQAKIFFQAVVKYEEELPPAPESPEEPIAHAVDRPVRLTVFSSGAEELSVYLTPGREPIQFIRPDHTSSWEQQ